MTTPISLPTNLVTSEPPQTSTAIAAETQVTSADILADAHDIKQTNFKKPSSTIQDLDELRSFQLAKRRDYEQQLNKNRLNYGQWMRYARWEIDHNHDFKRARSIMERALEVNVQHVPFWVRYIELELLHKNINHARNLLDRAVTILPRTDKFWFMYVQTEETLSNYHGVRTIFERWLKWKPTEAAWDAYVSFEERYAEYDKARAVFLRYVTEFPNGSTWQRWIVFETTLPHADDAHVARIRGIFEAAMDNLLASKSARSDPAVATIIVLWVRWEASVNESERASAILAAVLDQNLLSKDQKLEVLHSSNEFKDIGTTGSSLHLKKKLKLEKSVAENTRDYDAWWEYAKLQELTLGLSYAIELLTKAVETFPLDEFKSTSWRRYVFLWVKLALYTEYSVKDILKAREVWLKCLQVIPHGKFTFAKIWTMYAEFELRNGDGISQARKILGQAIGQSCRDRPKTKLFKYYIALEKRLGELERVRKVYEKWLESCLLSDKLNGGSSSVLVLQDYIDFEKSLGESERCVALFEIGISDAFVGGSSSVSGLPDNGLFENYIEFLKEEFRYEKARQVYRNGLDTSGAQSWIRFALFESSILSPAQMDELEKADTEEVSFQVEEYHLQQTRAIFSEAYTHFKNMRDGVNATSIVEAWLEYERMHGSKDQADKVEARRPKSITKRKTVDGVEEVYQEYEFPEMAPNLSKFLAKAKQWASASATTN
ncbi:hypothetical protein JCM33374_g4664 [Metschnikowia sp. JCM 33374]|nr:hypothetical protein JCM33374_g4664 [Metschnikowia sp. JCM 33374]